MSDQTIQVPPDGVGKKLDTEQLTVGANTVQRQRIQIAGAADTEIVKVLATTPSGSEQGLVVRPIQQVQLNGLTNAELRATAVPVSTALDALISAATPATTTNGLVVRPTKDITYAAAANANTNGVTPVALVAGAGVGKARRLLMVDVYNQGIVADMVLIDDTTQVVFQSAIIPSGARATFVFPITTRSGDNLGFQAYGTAIGSVLNVSIQYSNVTL